MVLYDLTSSYFEDTTCPLAKRHLEGLDWITALRLSAILKLADQGLIEASLFDDEDTKAPRPDVVVKKRPSASTQAKTKTKRTAKGTPVHSFQTLLKDLATICRNTNVHMTGGHGIEGDDFQLFATL